MKTETRDQTDIRRELIERGAELAIMEDRLGDTRSGWWLDGTYLGDDDTVALEAING